jgi:hypothetical protein
VSCCRSGKPPPTRSIHVEYRNRAPTTLDKGSAATAGSTPNTRSAARGADRSNATKALLATTLRLMTGGRGRPFNKTRFNSLSRSTERIWAHMPSAPGHLRQAIHWSAQRTVRQG